MKSSNKKKIEELKKKYSKSECSSTIIIYDPDGPLPELPGKGPYILLPDNGHRIAYQEQDEENDYHNRWFLKRAPLA
jgi:hypothetical protein